MTNEQKLEAVRKKIIEAVPSIIELHLGCKVIGILGMYTSTRKEITGAYLGRNSTHELLVADEDKTVRYFSDQELKIIGCTIRLADVLIAVDRRLGLWEYFENYVDSTLLDEIVIRWISCLDDLSLQPPKTIDLLYNLLCK